MRLRRSAGRSRSFLIAMRKIEVDAADERVCRLLGCGALLARPATEIITV
jgi:hypothetical protein